MPRLDIDMFDETPKIGNKVKVIGKVTDINEETGEVEVSYDDVSIIKNRKKRDSDKEDVMEDEMVVETEVEPNDQSLDSAMGRYFQNTQ